MLAKIFAFIITSTLIQSAIAEYVTIVPDNWGYIERTYRGEGYINSIHVRSTNSTTSPYSNSMSLIKPVDGYVPPHNGGSSLYEHEVRSMAEFSSASLSTSYDHYYFVLSPWSVYSGINITENVAVYDYAGNGVIELNDFARGDFFGTAQIKNPDDVSWYQPNALGGYQGDTYFDISELVINYSSQNIDYLGFNLKTLLANSSNSNSVYTGVLLRSPYIIASSEELGVSNVPLPAAAWLFGSALVGLAGIGRKRKQAA